MKKTLFARLLALSFVAFGAFVACAAEGGAPFGLTVEYRTNPVGLDAPVPRLAWRLPEGVAVQGAYELEADGKSLGTVSGDCHVGVAWPGVALGSGERHVWRVRVLDAKGVASPWSAPAEFTTGVMKPSDWKAKWIGPAACTRPDEDFGTGKWITAPAGKDGATVLEFGFDFAGAKDGECVEMVHAGVCQHEITVNGKTFNRWTGHVHDWRYLRFRDLTPYLVVGRNSIRVRVFADDGDVPGEPVPHIRRHAPAGVRAFLAKIVLPGGRTLVTDRTWTSPDGAVAELGGVRETAFGKEMVLRAENASPAFAKTFTVDGAVKSAVLHVTGVGFYEASLNGRKIGDKVLDPSPTVFDKRVLYSTYRLDGQLRKGANELRILVGHGWYDMRSIATWNFETAPWRDFPRTIAQLDITYADGRTASVVTDGTWRQVQSPVGYDCIFEGEVVGGANPAAPDLANFTVTAAEVPAPAGRLVAEAQPGAKVVRTVKAVAVHEIGEDACMIEFPENVSGWIRLGLRGQQKGDVVTIRYDERVNADFTPAKPSTQNGLDRHSFSNDAKFGGKTGLTRKIDAHYAYTASQRVCAKNAAFQTDRFISQGLPTETYEPRFVYHGFRYAYVSGLRRMPRAEDVVACSVRTDFAKTGSFECSNTDLNLLMAMGDRSYSCNFVDGIPTDCPHREKNGWTGDAAIASELAQYCYENTAGYEKYLRDICDTQLANGNICCICPTSGWGYHWGNGPAWDAALPVIAWTLRMYRGDTRIVEEVYPYLVRYLDYTATRADAAGLTSHGLGDWVPVVRGHMPSTTLVSSCYYYQAQRIAAEMAKLLGKASDVARFEAGAAKTCAGINARFYRGGGVYDNGGQTAQGVALAFGLVPQNEIPLVRAKLVESVQVTTNHVDLGLIGSKHVYRALSEAGRTDLAYKMIVNPTEPSMTAWFKRGDKGSALWEDWGDGASRCHIMFGDFVAWAYQYLAGIRLMPDARSTCAVPTGTPAFAEILLAPVPVDGLDYVTASTETPQGTVRSSWRREKGAVAYTFTVPAGAKAEIRLPGKAPVKVGSGTWKY